MDFSPSLQQGTLTSRYKRFFADVTLGDGTQITAHCPNTGPMLGVLAMPQKAWVTPHNNPKRKLQYTLEVVEHHGVLIGCNTHRTNHIAKELFLSSLSPFTATTIHTEVKLHDASRIDFVLNKDTSEEIYVEVKNVSYLEDTNALFPDTVSTRAQKHMKELISLRKQGSRTALVYIIQRGDATTCSPAFSLDPTYAALCVEAAHAGVELYAYTCDITPHSITATKQVPVVFPENE